MLDGIKNNIEKLIALYEDQAQENKRLRAELEKSKAENSTYLKKITDLEREVDNLKLTGAFTASSGDNSEAKEKIEKLIREMDRCISLLEK